MNELKKDEAGSLKEPIKSKGEVRGRHEGRHGKGKHGKGKPGRQVEKPRKHRMTMADEDRYFEES